MKTLFICGGNIARSQIAEAYYNFFTKSNNASSAGVTDLNLLEHSHPRKEVIQVMKEDGIDISKNVVKFITKVMVDNADKIFILCKKEECPKFLLDSDKIIFWDINDPNNTNIENHRRIRDEIKERVRQLIEK